MNMAPHRSVVERDRDRADIARMYCEGKTLRDIVQVISERYPGGRSLGTIASDLKAVRLAWRDSSIRDFDLKKGEELARLDRVEANAWLGWFRSLEDRNHQAQEETERPGPRIEGGRETLLTVRRTAKIERRDGNPYYLDLVMRCVERRCRILGLDAPAKVDFGDAGRTGIAAMVALAQNPEAYGDVGSMLPEEALTPPDTSVTPEA